MFTHDELIAGLSQIPVVESGKLEVVEYGNQDFQSPCSEQSIWGFRGSKQDFPSEVEFWLKTLLSQEWVGKREQYFAPYASAGLCQQLSKTEFEKLIAEYSRSLKEPLPQFLLNFAGFRSGMKMYADWNDVGAIAEFEDSFVAFYWSTTA